MIISCTVFPLPFPSFLNPWKQSLRNYNHREGFHFIHIERELRNLPLINVIHFRWSIKIWWILLSSHCQLVHLNIRFSKKKSIIFWHICLNYKHVETDFNILMKRSTSALFRSSTSKHLLSSLMYKSSSLIIFGTW